METYIAFLRGINVSGQKKIRMADLRLLLEGLGLEQLITYIQSGNVVFKTSETDKNVMENQIQEAIAKAYGFDVPVIVKDRSELEKIILANPYQNKEELEGNKIYFVLPQKRPQTQLVKAMQEITFENEQFVVGNDCIYLRCALGAGKAKCNNNFFERKLKVNTTTRNHRTLTKLLQLATG